MCRDHPGAPTESRRTSGLRWTYRMVMSIVEWPSSSCTAFSGTRIARCERTSAEGCASRRGEAPPSGTRPRAATCTRCGSATVRSLRRRRAPREATTASRTTKPSMARRTAARRAAPRRTTAGTDSSTPQKKSNATLARAMWRASAMRTAATSPSRPRAIGGSVQRAVDLDTERDGFAGHRQRRVR